VRIRIEHATTYHYQAPVRFGRHRLVLRPREGHDTRVELMRLQVEPAHRLEWVRDVFGNSVALVDFLEPAARLAIVSEVIVERAAPFPAGELHDPWRVPCPPVYEPLEAAVVAPYQAASFLDSAGPVQAWLQRDLVTDPADAEGTMVALAQLVHRTIGYRRRSEKGVQTPAETLTLATGSCRDMATLMMDAARLLGVAARFASGYLHCAASEAGHASTHAWAEVYLPALGWRGFDPTTGGAITPRHIVTGVSHHPRGVMPVSGVFIGAPSAFTTQEVTVRTEELSPAPR
jgi:transglutaminase-like putative cysteine protease